MLVGCAQFWPYDLSPMRTAYWEYPDLVPDIIPNRKERAGDKLAYLRLDSSVLPQKVQDKKVQDKGIEHCIDDIAAGGKSDFLRPLGAEDPISLKQEIQRDTDGIADEIGRKQAYDVI